MKRLLCLVLVVVATLSMFPIASASPMESEAVEYSAGNYKYVLLEDGTAEIVKYTIKWENEIVIPEKLDGHLVTSIRTKAFYGCSMVRVTIPDSIRHLTGNPFVGCAYLKTINISPDHPTLAIIGGVLFNKQQKALICCPLGLNQTEYTIPQGIRVIGDYAFYGYNYNESHGRRGLLIVTIPDSVTTIGEHAFSHCGSLKPPIFPDSITTIGPYAFSNGGGVNGLILPNGLTTVGEGAFAFRYGSGSITIPNSVSTLAGNPFYGDNSITIEVAPDHPTLEIIDGVLFDKQQKVLISYPKESKKTEYVIPEGIRAIADDAFYKCHSLRSVTIPDSVTTIGEYAFMDCSSLSGITIPSGVCTIRTGTFYNCVSLINLTLPDTIVTIEEHAFKDCSSLQNLNIPNSTISIGASAFWGCKSFTSISIPDSVVLIEEGAFGSCSNLESIFIPSNVTAIGKDILKFCDIASVVVEADSYAEEYCNKNRIPYTYQSSLDWLSD